MSRNLKDEGGSVQLPRVLAIGFTGHRKLPDEANSRNILYDFLAKKKSNTSEILVGVSSVAAGGDLLFAESCLALDISLRVLLPLPQEEFRKDFDATTWDRVQYVMNHALSVEVTGVQGRRDERYYECGLATVLQSQCLVALWDGQAARGLGGTEQIVNFALNIEKPLIWIHSETGAVEMRNEPKLSSFNSNGELEFLNRLHSIDASVLQQQGLLFPEAWLAKLDANALVVAPQVRRLAAVPIVCTAMAALVSGGASRMHGSGVWVALGAVLGLSAAVLPAALRLGARQAKWVRIRTAAEVTRSVCATWGTPLPYEVVGPEILVELGGMIASLNFLKLKEVRANAPEVHSFKERYLVERLLDQKQYFLGQSKKAALRGRRYRLLSKICVACAIVISIWSFGSASFLKGREVISWNTWLPLAASALFQVATIAGALLIVNDCDRRRRRYLEVHDSLASWELEFRAFQSWPAVIHVVNKVERALLVELLEWRSLLQNTKMPRS